MAGKASTIARDVRPAAAPTVRPDMVRIVGGANPEGPGPRETIGGNKPPADMVLEVQERLPVQFADLEKETAAALAKARDLPAEIASEDERAKTGDIMRELRDLSARAESKRVDEKTPFRRAAEAVDGFFNGFKDRTGKAFDILQSRLNVYQRKLAEAERIKREAEAREAQRKAAEARLAAEAEANRLAELERQRELAEERAAKSARQKPQHTAEVAARDVRGQEARTDALTAHADQLQRAADHAQDRTQASTADLVRQRTGAGAVITARTVKVVKIDDFSAVPLETLRPYIKRDEIERAVKQWAKVTGYAEPMPGVRIYDEDAAMVR